MGKLTRKFLISLLVILLSVAALSLYLNGNFVHRYYLHKEKKDINRVSSLLIEGMRKQKEKDRAWIKALIKDVEDREDVVVAWVEGTDDNTLLNTRLREAFLDKGISLKKYWLWEEDQQDAMEDGRRIRIYRQDQLRYSLLVEYLAFGDDFMAVAKIIPSMEQVIPIINQVTILIFAGAVFIIFILIFALVTRITQPLKAIGETAKAIANLDFKTVEIDTGDELEELAQDINHMSIRLKQAHEGLEHKNRQMEELLSHVSHDLKTPVSLIKAYAVGIKDGMDDGTFLDTIVTQNERMELLIERLLNLARMQKQEGKEEYLNVSLLLEEMLQALSITAQMQNLTFSCSIDGAVEVLTDKAAVQSIFSNLLSNAVKYGVRGIVRVTLEKREKGFFFRVENQIERGNEIDTAHIWDPFYVAEESRNKDMSGTGLGLSVVKAASQRCGASCSCRVEGEIIIFEVVV